MATPPLSETELARTYQAWIQTGGNKSAMARTLGISRATVQGRIHRLKRDGFDVVVCQPNLPAAEASAAPASEKPLVAGAVGGVEIIRRPLPPSGQVRRYILTSATNNTPIHAKFWQGIQTLAAHWSAEIMVRRIAYNLNAYRRMGAETELRSGEDAGPDEVFYDPAIAPYLSEERIELAPGLQWCGDIPITATAADPLSGLQTISGEASGIFAATALQMDSIPTPKHLPAKLNLTTGCATLRNYSRTKTGEKARWHHSYAALLIEVDSDGDWFPRHLIGNDAGAFNDLGLYIDGDDIHEADNIAAITLGDLHAAKLHAAVRSVIFGPGGMIDTLRPEEIHAHDLHDQESRNHHSRSKAFERFRLFRNGRDTILDELMLSAAVLQDAAALGVKIVVVDSNHHDHLERHLQEADWRDDPPNMRFHLEAAARRLQAIEEGDRDFLLFEWACRRAGAPESVHFLRPDQSYVVEGIECGQHGHNGPNGARGGLRNFARMGTKSNIAHIHSPGRYQGCLAAGVTAGDMETLNMGYNKGPGSWARAHIVTYYGGKRTHLIMRGLKYRAVGEPCRDALALAA